MPPQSNDDRLEHEVVKAFCPTVFTRPGAIWPTCIICFRVLLDQVQHRNGIHRHCTGFRKDPKRNNEDTAWIAWVRRERKRLGYDP